MANENNVKTLSGINIIAAIWLVLAPFIFGYVTDTVALWNNIIFGVIIGIFAIIRVSQPNRNTWLSWANAIFGLWMLVAPFVILYANAAALWNNIITGAIVAILAAWSASEGQIAGPERTGVQSA